MKAEGMLTVDLEDWYHANYDDVDPAAWASLESTVCEHTAILLDLFGRHNCKATFFTLGVVAEKHPELIRAISEKGHEIACHSHAHLKVSDLGPDGFREDLQKARAAIFSACAVEPKGFRAPSWSISPPEWKSGEESHWALRILKEEGFDYDASLFPFKTYLYGVANAPTGPHKIHLNGGGDIYELPASVSPFMGKKIPFGGGFYFRAYPLAMTEHLCRKYYREHSMPFMYYIHPREICPRQPHLKLNWKERTIHYINLERNLEKLDQLLGVVRFDTVASFLEGHGASLPQL